MSATCPACGVAVVPGYAKCPKCHAPLPYGAGRGRARTVAGGTVAEDKRFPWQVIAVPIGVVIVIVVLLKLISGGDGKSEEAIVAEQQIAAQNQQGTTTTTTAQTVEPQQTVQQPTQPQAPDPRVAVGELDRALRARRFWSTVEVFPPRVDVRSASCDDPGMAGAIDGVTSVLRSAGLTQLRCLAQSGTVVFERNL